MSSIQTTRALRLGLIIAVLAIYARVGTFDFVNYDDDVYVYNNLHVQRGLTLDSFKWALTAVVSGNWMPVTIFCHLLDVQLFGLRSGMHHLTNVVIHTLSALLLFTLLQRATRAMWQSAFVAFVFAVHPLHAESVAWVAERKDVLSGFFFFLTLYCYILYVERPHVGRYLLVLGVFCVGLMSKPMLVTLPFVLLIFDYWPLVRLREPRIVWEKVPLFALSAAASAVTYFVQRASGAVHAVAPSGRVENALISYVTYIEQSFWPTRLAVFYPYPHSIATWRAVAAGGVLLAVSGCAIGMRRTRPYLLAGWLWYLGMLVPVIGLVQVGLQSHADRYTYLPLVGLSIMVAWGAAEVVERWAKEFPGLRSAAAAVAVLFCAVCAAMAWNQVGHWRNAETLFQHAIDVTRDNWVAEGALGDHLMKVPGRRSDAVEHLEAALRLKPDYPLASTNLGVCLAEAGLCEAAIPRFEAALRVDPNLAEASNDLGSCLMGSGQYTTAISYFKAALRSDPDYVNAHLNLGRTLAALPGHSQEAIAQFEAVVRLRPDNEVAHHNLGVLLAGLGRTEQALAHFEAAQQIRFDPERAATIERLRAGQK